MKKIFMVLSLGVVMALTIFVVPATSESVCGKISHWSDTSPPINQQHVFCGEWNKRKNRPVGFHSRPGSNNPATVGRLKITQQPNAEGLYGVRWSYAGHPDRPKFSSMFPDTCSRDQVLKSIVYAARHPKSCPDGAPHWMKCGSNKPRSDGDGYCEALDGSVFKIGFATLRNSSKINTAFPIVE
jgi:hypothetical protein